MPPSKVPTLSSDRALQGVPNYTNWTVRMHAQHGQIQTLSSAAPCLRLHGTQSPAVSTQLGTALPSAAASLAALEIVPYFSEHFVASAWSFLASRSALTDTQATLRVLRDFWPLCLTAANPAALDTFELEYYGIVLCIDQLKIDVSTLCSTHLLSALPPSLDSLNTWISAYYRHFLSVSGLPACTRDQAPLAQPPVLWLSPLLLLAPRLSTPREHHPPVCAGTAGGRTGTGSALEPAHSAPLPLQPPSLPLLLRLQTKLQPPHLPPPALETSRAGLQPLRLPHHHSPSTLPSWTQVLPTTCPAGRRSSLSSAVSLLGT